MKHARSQSVHNVEHLQPANVTTLEADSVQTIRSLKDLAATLERKLDSVAAPPLTFCTTCDTNVHEAKVRSLSEALYDEQIKNAVLTLCNTQLEAAAAKPVELTVNVAAAAGPSSNALGKRPRPPPWSNEDDVASAQAQRAKMSKHLAMTRLQIKKLRDDNDFLKSAFEDLVENAHCLLASIQQENDVVSKNGKAFEKTLNRVLKHASDKA